jgi:glycosyltransferase involved in cell wall biosynthesis
MPVYNPHTRHGFLNEAINSYKEQTYMDKELIIVNDGSTDDSLGILKSHECDDIKLFNKENGGQPSAQNHGIKNCNGDLITLLDDDDMFFDKYSLEKRMEQFSDDIDVLITSYVEQYGSKYNISELETDNEKLKQLLWGKFGAFALQGVTWRKGVHEKIGYFDEALTSVEDCDMKIRLINECTFKAVNIPTYRHRYHPAMRSDIHRRSGELEKNKSYILHKLTNKYKGEKNGSIDK